MQVTLASGAVDHRVDERVCQVGDLVVEPADHAGREAALEQLAELRVVRRVGVEPACPRELRGLPVATAPHVGVLEDGDDIVVARDRGERRREVRELVHGALLAQLIIRAHRVFQRGRREGVVVDHRHCITSF